MYLKRIVTNDQSVRLNVILDGNRGDNKVVTRRWGEGMSVNLRCKHLQKAAVCTKFPQ